MFLPSKVTQFFESPNLSTSPSFNMGGSSNYEEVPEFKEHCYGSLFKSCFEKQISKKLK